ncbi:hypothetical protein ELP17_37335, partial [Klebsiella pneumoniae]|nr:hypothetical protein [Klebsiella pneumoniae]
IKSLLLKRFESSVEAFRISLRRQINFHERFIEELMHGHLLSSADYRHLLALENEEEASALLLSLPTVDASAYRVLELARV